MPAFNEDTVAFDADSFFPAVYIITPSSRSSFYGPWIVVSSSCLMSSFVATVVATGFNRLVKPLFPCILFAVTTEVVAHVPDKSYSAAQVLITVRILAN